MNILAIDDEEIALDGKIYAVNLYQGEYMAQYSWAEMTGAGIKVTT